VGRGEEAQSCERSELGVGVGKREWGAKVYSPISGIHDGPVQRVSQQNPKKVKVGRRGYGGLKRVKVSGHKFLVKQHIRNSGWGDKTCW